MASVKLFETTIYTSDELPDENAETIAHNISLAVADVFRAAGVGSSFGAITAIYTVTDDALGHEEKEFVRVKVASVDV